MERLEPLLRLIDCDKSALLGYGPSWSSQRIRLIERKTFQGRSELQQFGEKNAQGRLLPVPLDITNDESVEEAYKYVTSTLATFVSFLYFHFRRFDFCSSRALNFYSFKNIVDELQRVTASAVQVIAVFALGLFLEINIQR